MGAGDAQLRRRFRQEFRDLVEIGDARGNIEGLAAAVALAPQGFAQDHRIERRDVGADRQAVNRRRRDQRQFADARQRQLQCARDRRR